MLKKEHLEQNKEYRREKIFKILGCESRNTNPAFWCNKSFNFDFENATYL
jgi:hypothetical protein